MNKIIISLIAIAVVGLAVFFAGCIEEEIPVKLLGVGEPKLIIKSLNVEYDGYGSTIDDIKIEFKGITLKNLGDGSFGSSFHSQKIIFEVVVNNQNNSVYTYAYIKPNESWRPASAYLEDLSLDVERQSGEYELEGILCIKDESEKIMDSKNFSVSIPTARIGDTILLTRGGFDMTLNSWYLDEVGKVDTENWKNVVLNVTIKNSYHRERKETPAIFASVMSDRGWVQYSGWTSFSENLSPLSYEDLYPEEEITGEIRVTIPINWNPVEMCISCTDEIILLS